MKKLLPLFVCAFLFGNLKSQIVFCPPGAEWHYNFILPRGVENEKIRYDRDSVIGTETFKVLTHTRYYFNCNFRMPTVTLIKQKGDTVFFRNNRTQNTWQILYNFGVQPGQGWQCTYLDADDVPIVRNPIVDSIGYVNINTITLKRLYQGSYYVTERFGSMSFLFDFSNVNCELGDSFVEFLCYRDNSFGLKQFSNKSCDYEQIVGLKEYASNSSVKLFPNPAQDFITIDIDSPENAELSFTDISGREIKKIKLEQNSKIPVSELGNGIYLITITKGSEKIYTTKFIKD